MIGTELTKERVYLIVWNLNIFRIYKITLPYLRPLLFENVKINSKKLINKMRCLFNRLKVLVKSLIGVYFNYGVY